MNDTIPPAGPAAGPDAFDFDTAFPTTRPWLPEDLDAIRARADLVPAVVRPIHHARVNWVMADRKVHETTVAGDPEAIAAAEFDKTAAAGEVLAEQYRLVEAVQAVIREVGYVRPQLLARLVLDALAEAARSDPVRLANVLKPIVKALLEVLLEKAYADLHNRLQDVERGVVSIVKRFAAKLGVAS